MIICCCWSDTILIPMDLSLSSDSDVARLSLHFLWTKIAAWKDIATLNPAKDATKRATAAGFSFTCVENRKKIKIQGKN